LEAIGNIIVHFMNEGKLPWDLKRPNELKIDMKDPKAYQN